MDIPRDKLLHVIQVPLPVASLSCDVYPVYIASVEPSAASVLGSGRVALFWDTELGKILT